MAEQLELTYSRPVAPDPGVADLEAWLEQARGWRSAEEIAAATGWDDRRIRDLASESDLVISSPGKRGYRHIDHVTRAEYDHYRNARRSQARKMVGKVIRTDRIFFRHHPA
jgi:hypothetical protein